MTNAMTTAHERLKTNFVHEINIIIRAPAYVDHIKLFISYLY